MLQSRDHKITGIFRVTGSITLKLQIIWSFSCLNRLAILQIQSPQGYVVTKQVCLAGKKFSLHSLLFQKKLSQIKRIELT